MNLFVSGWGLEADRCRLVLAALEKTAKSYSSLDNGEGFSWQSECNSVVLGCQFPSSDCLDSRQYVSDTDQSVVVYDGLPVDGDGRFSAHNAGELARNWDDSADKLDGFFCGIRIQKKALQLEVQLDDFGVYPVFYWTNGKSWLISNSVALLDRVTSERALDASGVSRFLTMGWVAGDRTLRKGVRVFPAGERWVWSEGKAEPTSLQTLQRRALANKTKSKLTRSDIVKLGEDMARPMISLGKDFENILCPLTGGKDSRVLAALLAANHVAARYYTYGSKIGRDAEIASQVASALNVNHETLLAEAFDLSANWDGLAKLFVTRADGMCPLQLIMGALTAKEVAAGPIPVRIWGAGGELARAPYFNPVHDFRGASLRDMQDNIARRWIDSANGMMRPDACAESRSFVDETMVRYADDGFAVNDLSDVFFLYERAGRRTGKNMRATMEMRDSYSPFYRRAFAEAVFSLDARSRRTEPLHYRLIEQFAPAVLKIPFDKGGWTNRSPSLNLYSEVMQQVQRRLSSKMAKRVPWARQKANRHFIVKDTMFERVKWLKQLQHKLREMCLDGSSSPVWDFVDRDKFDAVTDPSSPESELSANARALFLTATLFYYESHGNSIKMERAGSDVV
jgi:asparagine synthase (glutamine-hydrolysing)